MTFQGLKSAWYCKSSWSSTPCELSSIKTILFMTQNRSFGGKFWTNFNIGKSRGPEIQMAIFSKPFKIFKFRQKRCLRIDGIFNMSFTCKNDPRPPYRLNSSGYWKSSWSSTFCAISCIKYMYSCFYDSYRRF